MSVKIIVEKPLEEAIEYDLTPENMKILDLDKGDIAYMERGHIIWIGETAISIEGDENG